MQSEHKSSSLFLNLIFFSLLLGGCVLTPVEPGDQSLDSGVPQEPVETATKIVAEGSPVGAEGSLTGAEGSLTGAEGSLIGAEGSLTGAESSLTDADGTLGNLEVPDLLQRISRGHNLTPEVLSTVGSKASSNGNPALSSSSVT